MKKFISLFLLLALVLSMPVCMAEGEAEAEMKDLSGVKLEDVGDLKRANPEKLEEGEKGSITQDVVTIDVQSTPNQYRVVTPDHITLTYLASENAIALTQDLIQQADWFVQIYKDPVAIVNRWIGNGTHLNIYEMSTQTDIYVHVLDTGLSSIYPDSSRLSEEEASYIIKFLTSQGYLEGATEATVGWLGKNVWFLGDMRSVDGSVTLVSFVGGKTILAYAGVENDDQYNTLISELENLAIGVA